MVTPQPHRIAWLVLSLVGILLLSATPSSCFWIFSHSPLGLNARLDPIVTPGGISSHLHTFVGSNAITASQNNATITDSNACTTAQVQADKSSYWTPTLFKYYRGAFEAFPLAFVNTYYLQRGNMSLQAFPPGLRMVAGSAGARGPQATKQLQNVVSFVCLNYDTGGSQTMTMPNGTCPQGLRAQLIFPSCWDGVNLDSPDHKSHVAYPIGDNPDNGDACPSTHPIRFITLFYEFIWSVGSLPNNGSWVFANGDAVGWSFHGDFMNGWDTDVLQSAITNCTGSLFGNLEACPAFNATLNRDTAANCVVDLSKVTGRSPEQVNGKLSSLPGNNPIFNGPLVGANDSTTSNDMPDGYKGCYTDQNTNGIRTLPNLASAGSSNTIEGCRASCDKLGYPIAGLEYGRECWCGNQLSYDSLLVLDTDCNMPCTGNTTQTCGDGKRLSVYSNLTTIPTASAAPSAPSTIAGTSFQSLGCYSDSTSQRTFPNRVSGDSLEKCAASCSNYAYFGMEYASECYCGNTLSASKIADSSCNMLCSSNSSELCGGSNALNIYQQNIGTPASTVTTTTAASTSSIVVPTSTNTSSSITTSTFSSTRSSTMTSSSSTQSSAPTSTPSTSALLSGTRAIGCYVDKGDRSLSYTAYSNKQNTPSVCAAACRAKGYKYSGTEYGSECYCGNYLLNLAASGSVQDGCTMKCSGDSSSICGGSNRLSIVQDDKWVQSLFTVTKTGKWNFTDCIIDSPSQRSLKQSVSVANTTPESCLAACLAKKLTYCGVEYSGECYGSTVAPTAATAPSVGNTDPLARGCSMPCKGNSSLACGGSSRLNLYTYLGNGAASVSPSKVR